MPHEYPMDKISAMTMRSRRLPPSIPLFFELSTASGRLERKQPVLQRVRAVRLPSTQGCNGIVRGGEVARTTRSTGLAPTFVPCEASWRVVNIFIHHSRRKLYLVCGTYPAPAILTTKLNNMSVIFEVYPVIQAQIFLDTLCYENLEKICNITVS